MTTAPPCAAPDFAPRAPRVQPPLLACDCHAHILGPAATYRYSDHRVYTPPDCLLTDYQAMLKVLGISRSVLVQPSVYGQDNRVMLKALEEMKGAWRGVAVVKSTVSDKELTEMHDAGVRGIRVNIVDIQNKQPRLPIAELRPLAQRIRALGWHIEFLLHVSDFPNLDQDLADFPVDTVFGHLGYSSTALGIDDPGFQALLRMLKTERAWVKLTGPYRISTRAMPYPDVSPFAQALLETSPNQLLWGSDWPHVMVKGTMPNDGDLLDLLPVWIPDPVMQQKILVRNPERLYGFQRG